MRVPCGTLGPRPAAAMPAAAPPVESTHRMGTLPPGNGSRCRLVRAALSEPSLSPLGTHPPNTMAIARGARPESRHASGSPVSHALRDLCVHARHPRHASIHVGFPCGRSDLRIPGGAASCAPGEQSICRVTAPGGCTRKVGTSVRSHSADGMGDRTCVCSHSPIEKLTLLLRLHADGDLHR